MIFLFFVWWWTRDETLPTDLNENFLTMQKMVSKTFDLTLSHISAPMISAPRCSSIPMLNLASSLRIYGIATNRQIIRRSTKLIMSIIAACVREYIDDVIDVRELYLHFLSSSVHAHWLIISVLNQKTRKLQTGTHYICQQFFYSFESTHCVIVLSLEENFARSPILTKFNFRRSIWIASWHQPWWSLLPFYVFKGCHLFLLDFFEKMEGLNKRRSFNVCKLKLFKFQQKSINSP